MKAAKVSHEKIGKPAEGDVFVLQLDDGRYALAVMARVETEHPRKPYGIFVYFYGPYNRIPQPPFEATVLNQFAAVKRLNTSALDIYLGLWRKLGSIDKWQRTEWEFPNFYEEDFLTGKFTMVELEEASLARVVRQTSIAEKNGLERNISYGSESARRHVSRLMLPIQSLDSLQ